MADLSQIVNVNININTRGVDPRIFGRTLFITTDTTLPSNDSIQLFDNFQDIESFFPVSSAPYTAGQVYFAQSPIPKSLWVGRWFKTAQAVELRGGTVTTPLATFQSISDGAFDITIGSFTRQVTGLDFTTALSFSDIAATIQSALGAAKIIGGLNNPIGDFQAISDGSFTINSTEITGLDFTAAVTFADVASIITAGLAGSTLDLSTVTYDNVNNRFEFVAAQSIESVTFASAAASGTDISTIIAWTAPTNATLLNPAIFANNVYDPQTSNFILTGQGITTQLNFASAATGGGTDISTLLAWTQATGAIIEESQAAETIQEAIARFQQATETLGTFYFVTIETAERDTTTIIDISTLLLSQPYIFFAESADPNVLITNETSSIFAQLFAQGSERTAGDWQTPTQITPALFTEYLAVSSAARLSSINFDGTNSIINPKFKDRPLIQPSTLTSNQQNEIDSKRINVFVPVGGGTQSNTVTNIYQQGTVFANNLFQDTRYAVDWLQNAIQVAVFDLLLQVDRVSQTTTGQAQVSAVIESVLLQAVRNGLIAPGQLSDAATQNVISITGNQNFNGNLINGFLIYFPPIATLSEQERIDRLLPIFYFWAKGSGAVNFITIEGNFDQ